MKSEILREIKEDLKLAMALEVQYRKLKTYADSDAFKQVITQKEVSRAIISMFPEIGVKPDKASDIDTVKLIKKYINMEKTRLLYVDKHLTEGDVSSLSSTELNKLVTEKIDELGSNLSSDKIVIAKKYLPPSLSEEELIEWIKENIDFSKLKNKMQAMGIIMKQYSGMDGNFVKKVLINNF